MSDVSDAARVQVFLADHAVSDASNKINALGVGFQLSALQPTGFSAPQSVVVLVETPSSFAGTDMAFELGLYVAGSNELVQAPALMGQETSGLRFAQNVMLEPTVVSLPGLRVPRGVLWSRHQVFAVFQNGVPVMPGQSYEWRASIDTATGRTGRPVSTFRLRPVA